jgi:DNA-binding transcriptional LysR family regulator
VDRLRGRIVFRCNSAWTMLAAVRAGAGLGVLPCYLADPDRSLVRAVPAMETREIWLAVHGEVRRSPRARVGLDFLARVLADAGPLLRGEATETPEAPPQARRRGLPKK